MFLFGGEVFDAANAHVMLFCYARYYIQFTMLLGYPYHLRQSQTIRTDLRPQLGYFETDERRQKRYGKNNDMIKVRV